MAIKVIIMDIDGTLVNDEKVITPLTKETLLKAQDKGVRLVLASGRPTSGLLKLAEELDMENHHGLFVCFNGSKVVDCQSHETLYNHAISVEDSKAILEHLKNFKARPMFDKDEYMYVNINSSVAFLAHWIFPFTALLFTVIVIFPVVLSYDQLFLEKLSPFASPFVAFVEFATTVTVSGYLLLIFGALTSMFVFFIGNTLFSTYDVILP